MELISLFAMIAGLVLILVRMIGRIRIERKSMLVAFYLFGIMSVLLSDLYWLAFYLLYPGQRPPFAANLIGEWAFFMLFSAAVEAEYPGRFRSARKETIGGVLFMAVNACFWIAWSGRWLEDILSAFFLGYLACTVLRCLKTENVFTKAAWRGWAILTTSLLLLQTGTFLVPEGMKKFPDAACYILMFSGLLYLGWRIWFCGGTEEKTDEKIILSFAGTAWALISLYMSGGIMYAAVEFCLTGALLSAMVFIGKKVEGL